MNNKILAVIFSSLLLVSCASIPKETVTLSKTIGSDLQILHNSQRNMVQLYYNGIKHNINAFIDDVYAPFIIHHVLEIELNKHKKRRIVNIRNYRKCREKRVVKMRRKKP